MNQIFFRKNNSYYGNFSLFFFYTLQLSYYTRKLELHIANILLHQFKRVRVKLIAVHFPTTSINWYVSEMYSITLTSVRLHNSTFPNCCHSENSASHNTTVMYIYQSSTESNKTNNIFSQQKLRDFTLFVKSFKIHLKFFSRWYAIILNFQK